MTQFSALLIGNESLTQQCGAMLLARGHSLSCVVTRNAEVRKWALAQGLRVEARVQDVPGQTVDWLLSVANLSVIPKAVLACASKGAVNFHDGPLPRHAGLNAPVWAILNGEAQHGISWHLMTGGIDEGDVLEQRTFDIAPHDTALTLNTRCFDAAIDSFPALLAQLESGVLARKPQDMTQRSLHLRHDRPAAMGRIDFTQSVKAVLRLVRALDHGRYWNPLSTAKIATSDRVLNVGAAERADGAGAPGTVLAVDDSGLVVACQDGAVRLMKLTCQDNGLAVRPGGVTDVVLPPIPAGLTESLAAVVPFEAGLRQALLALQPAVVPGTAGGSGWASVSVIT